MGADCCGSIFGRLIGSRHAPNKLKKGDQSDDELGQFLQLDYSDSDEDGLGKINQNKPSTNTENRLFSTLNKMQDYMAGNESASHAESKVPSSAQDDTDSDEESSMITRTTAKDSDLICSKDSTNSVTNRFSDKPDHNEADQMADQIEETLMSYSEPLDTDSLPKPMFGAGAEDEAPKFGAFETGSEDGMPLASQENEIFNTQEYSQPQAPANTFGDFNDYNPATQGQEQPNVSSQQDNQQVDLLNLNSQPAYGSDPFDMDQFTNSLTTGAQDGAYHQQTAPLEDYMFAGNNNNGEQSTAPINTNDLLAELDNISDDDE